MQNLMAVLVVVVLLAMYVTWLAGRLDRQHVRVEAGRSALDAALLRRAALAEELAELVRLPSVTPAALASDDADTLAAGLAAAARAARDAGPEQREQAENDLTRRLRPLVTRLTASGADVADERVAALLASLDAATSRVALARNISKVAVDHTLALRRRRIVRWLHLAGRAAAPAYFEIDDSPLAGDHSISPRPARREP